MVIKDDDGGGGDNDGEGDASGATGQQESGEQQAVPPGETDDDRAAPNTPTVEPIQQAAQHAQQTGPTPTATNTQSQQQGLVQTIDSDADEMLSVFEDIKEGKDEKYLSWTDPVPDGEPDPDLDALEGELSNDEVENLINFVKNDCERTSSSEDQKVVVDRLSALKSSDLDIVSDEAIDMAMQKIQDYHLADNDEQPSIDDPADPSKMLTDKNLEIVTNLALLNRDRVDPKDTGEARRTMQSVFNYDRSPNSVMQDHDLPFPNQQFDLRTLENKDNYQPAYDPREVDDVRVVTVKKEGNKNPPGARLFDTSDIRVTGKQENYTARLSSHKREIVTGTSNQNPEEYFDTDDTLVIDPDDAEGCIVVDLEDPVRNQLEYYSSQTTYDNPEQAEPPPIPIARPDAVRPSGELGEALQPLLNDSFVPGEEDSKKGDQFHREVVEALGYNNYDQLDDMSMPDVKNEVAEVKRMVKNEVGLGIHDAGGDEIVDENIGARGDDVRYILGMVDIEENNDGVDKAHTKGILITSGRRFYDHLNGEGEPPQITFNTQLDASKWNNFLENVTLSQQQWEIHEAWWDDPTATQAEIADKVGCDQSTVSRMKETHPDQLPDEVIERQQTLTSFATADSDDSGSGDGGGVTSNQPSGDIDFRQEIERAGMLTDKQKQAFIAYVNNPDASQAELAEECGVSQPYISQTLNNYQEYKQLADSEIKNRDNATDDGDE